MAKNEKATSQTWLTADHQLERMSRNQRLALIQEVMDESYRDGRLVKALDEVGEPLIRKGQQVYKAVDHATAAERAFWRMENMVN